MGIFNKRKKDLEEVQEVNDNKENSNELEFKIAYSDEENARMSEVQKQFLEEELTNLPAIERGQINISDVYFAEVHGKIEVKAFIRNGLEKQINFEELPFIIVNSKNETVARQVFNLSDIGDIPPLSAKSIKLYFDKESFIKDEGNYEDFKLCFGEDLGAANSLQVELENLLEDVPLEEKSKCKKFLESLPKLVVGNVDMNCVDLNFSGIQGLVITIIIRNGFSQEVVVNSIPLTIIDANGQVIAKGEFNLENFNVSPKKAKIINLIFPKENILVDSFDLSSWKVKFSL